MSNTYASELSVTNTTGETLITEETQGHEIIFPAGERTQAAGWQLMDRYVLEDLEGNQVLAWDVRTDTTATSSYTENLESGGVMSAGFTLRAT